MAGLTNAEFLLQKKTNFCRYAVEQAKKHEKKEGYSEYIKRLEEFEGLPADLFTSFIVTELLQYKQNLQAFLVKTLEGSPIKVEELEPAVREKLLLYFRCWIDVVEAS